MKFSNAVDAFHYLLTQGEQELETNLAKIKHENLEIFDDIKQLIQAHRNNVEHTEFNSIISEQASNVVNRERIFNLLNQQVGVYQLTKLIGQGGMGVVYLGERNDGKLKQKVAIKFIFPAFSEVLGQAHFLNEAQYLADLDHTNICKIITVGTTSDQSTYLVMEYIEGQSIDQYCQSNELNLQDKLRLFTKVCQAVQHAHNNMVIHADIKPSNILVDQYGEPKLMDFGIAQNIQKAKTDQVYKLVQQAYLKALSREYAAPEQINGAPLSSGSDTYALGKLLAHLIKNESLSQQVKELQQIINHLCQSDINKRICSISILLNLIQQQKDGYPIDQYSKSAFYRFKKLINRNKAPFAALSACFLILASASIMLSWQNNKLKEQTEIATKTQQYITDLFSYTDPDNHEKLTVYELLNKGEKQLSVSAFSNDNVLASIKMSMATAFAGMGEFSDAQDLLIDAKQLLARSDNDDLRFMVNHRLALLNISLNQFDQASVLFEENGKRANLPLELQLMHWYGFGDLHFAKGEFNKAIAFYEKSLAGHRTMAKPDQDTIAIILNNLSNAYKDLGNPEKALTLIQESLQISTNLYGNIAHPRIATRLTNLGAIQNKLGMKKQAAVSFEKALAIFREIAPHGHKKEAAVINNIGALYSESGNIKKALVYLNMSLDKVKETFGENHVNTAILSNNIANAYREVSELEKALVMHQQALNIFDKLNVQGINLAVFKSNYARTLHKSNQRENALREVNEAIDILTSVDKSHKGLIKLAQLKEQITNA